MKNLQQLRLLPAQSALEMVPVLLLTFSTQSLWHVGTKWGILYLLGVRKLGLATLWAFIFITGVNPSAASYQQKYVIAPGGVPSNHGSSIVALGNGTFLSCWYGGSYETAADAKIYCSRLVTLGGKWSAPKVVVGSGETATKSWFANGTLGNTALHLAKEGTLWLFYNATTIFRGWSTTHVAYKTSTDGGQSWSQQGTKITSFWGNSIKSKPLALGQDRMLLPLYHELFGTYGYTCLFTADTEKLVDKRCAVIPGQEHLQPALVRFPSGRIGAYLRNKRKQNVLLSILSPDLDNWSNPFPVNLPNPNAPVDVIPVSEGRLLAVYNRSSTDRSVLSLAVTTDGVRFDWLKDLENDPTAGRFSYPTIIQDRHGLFHVVYTYRRRAAIKHVIFDAEWLHR